MQFDYETGKRVNVEIKIIHAKPGLSWGLWIYNPSLLLELSRFIQLVLVVELEKYMYTLCHCLKGNIRHRESARYLFSNGEIIKSTGMTSMPYGNI